MQWIYQSVQHHTQEHKGGLQETNLPGASSSIHRSRQRSRQQPWDPLCAAALRPHAALYLAQHHLSIPGVRAAAAQAPAVPHTTPRRLPQPSSGKSACTASTAQAAPGCMAACSTCRQHVSAPTAATAATKAARTPRDAPCVYGRTCVQFDHTIGCSAWQVVA